jgi:hypothetical protein
VIGNVALVWHIDLNCWSPVLWTQEMIDPVSEDDSPDDRVCFAPIDDEI